MVAVGFGEIARMAIVWATVALMSLVVVRHVLQPRLTEVQRHAFDIVLVPLLAVFVIYIVANFLEALP